MPQSVVHVFGYIMEAKYLFLLMPGLSFPHLLFLVLVVVIVVSFLTELFPYYAFTWNLSL